MSLVAAVFTASLAWSSAANAEDDAVKAVVSAVEAKYSGVSVMKASFTQTVANPVFGEEQSTGQVVIKRPSKMKWDFEGDKAFVSNGDTLWVYSKADKQVIKYSGVKAAADNAQNVLDSLDKLRENYEVVLGDATASHVDLQLTPRDQTGAPVKSVELRLSKPAYLLETVKITDPFDTVTELKFRDVKLNSPVPDSTFEFQVPAGVQLIDAGALPQ